ncbi:signal peptidase complex subunit 3-like [Brachionus plicatilis]|uniref:Signal peptidase complex subunit 3 n=1 Tax=Brachionus plicatilis TaxID=10195 RepID=A0A3M7RNY7_BRAPC|nr:signal peptidase complex subunit 3-like [Brachionus plicatilis]
MHSLLSRANALFAFTLTVTGVLAFGLFLTTFIYEQNGTVKINSAKATVKHLTEFGAGKKKNDIGFFNFDLDADFEPLFNWNVKQLFLYLTAEYTTPRNKLNEVVLWDKIVLKGDNYKLKMRNAKTKYFFWDDGTGLKGNKNVTLYLTWNIIPNVGGLPNIPVDGAHRIVFPDQYASSA